MSPLVVPVVSTHQSHRRSRDTEMANSASRRIRRTKSEQPTLVIMPDGHSLCFAIRDPPVARDPSGSSRKPAVQHSNDMGPDADQPTTATASNQQQAFPFLPARYVARTLGASRQEPMQRAGVPVMQSTLPGSTQTGSSAS